MNGLRNGPPQRQSPVSIVGKPNTSNRTASAVRRRTGYGTTRAGTQRYRCYDCGRTFVQTYTHKARDPLIKEQITQMVLNGAGIRYTARILGVNRNTVSNQFKINGAAL